MKNKYKQVIFNLYKSHVQGTSADQIVINKTAFLCQLTNTVAKSLDITERKIYISTRVLKPFRIRKESYLKNYTILWSWEDGESPS